MATGHGHEGGHPPGDRSPNARRANGGIRRPGHWLRRIALVPLVAVAALILNAVASPSSTLDTAGNSTADTAIDTDEPVDDLTIATSGEATVSGFAALSVESARSPDDTPPPKPLDHNLMAGFGRAEMDMDQAAADNLALITAASVRNTNHDASPWADTPSDQLVLENHYGSRSDYLGNPAGNPEQAFPVPQGGQFRTSCEFSHFAYDDPLVHPAMPGASHLHMYFGNTRVNAFSTYESLIDSGSSTCNGQELNRTGYWVPALFDDRGNVRVPERIVVYYKGENLARGNSDVYPPGAAMIATKNLNAEPPSEGGVGGAKFTFACSDNFSTNTGQGGQTMPGCDGSQFGTDPGRWTVLEMSVKFPQCWNGRDAADWNNFSPPVGDWYVSRCEGEYNRTFPNLEYFVDYRVEPGENTAGWFLASDVDPVTFTRGDAAGGSTVHGDWWGGWHPDVNRMWIDNCVNYVNPSGAPSGCGMGYLTDGGPDGNTPVDGPALKYRPQYDGPYSVPAEVLYRELCPQATRPFGNATDAAYCTPGTGHGAQMGHD